MSSKGKEPERGEITERDANSRERRREYERERPRHGDAWVPRYDSRRHDEGQYTSHTYSPSYGRPRDRDHSRDYRNSRDWRDEGEWMERDRGGGRGRGRGRGRVSERERELEREMKRERHRELQREFDKKEKERVDKIERDNWEAHHRHYGIKREFPRDEEEWEAYKREFDASIRADPRYRSPPSHRPRSPNLSRRPISRSPSPRGYYTRRRYSPDRQKVSDDIRNRRRRDASTESRRSAGRFSRYGERTPRKRERSSSPLHDRRPPRRVRTESMSPRRTENKKEHTPTQQCGAPTGDALQDPNKVTSPEHSTTSVTITKESLVLKGIPKDEETGHTPDERIGEVKGLAPQPTNQGTTGVGSEMINTQNIGRDDDATQKPAKSFSQIDNLASYYLEEFRATDNLARDRNMLALDYVNLPPDPKPRDKIDGLEVARIKRMADEFGRRPYQHKLESDAAMALFEVRSAEQRRTLASQLHEQYKALIS